jgi:streptogramin lyase
VLRVDSDQSDLGRFEALRDRARAARAPGRAGEAASAHREARELWRGPALGDLAYESFARAEAERLEELRLVALDERIEADLALGRHVELVPELEALIARHPLRERLREQLMLALYRSGRQADALGVYRDTRRRLADELGIEPSPRLQELERAILRQEPELGGEAVPRAAPRRTLRRRRRLLFLLAAALAFVAAVALGLALTRDARSPVVPPNSVAVIDPARSEIVAAVPVGESPGPIVAGLGAVWVFNWNDATISKLDPAKLKTVDVIAGVAEPRGGQESTSVALLAAGEGALWTGHATTLRRSEPDRLARLEVIDTGEVGFWDGIATGLGKVWLVGYPRSLLAIHAERASIEQVVRLDTLSEDGRGSVAVGASFVWAAFAGEAPALYRYDPVGREIARLPLEGSPSALAVSRDAVWVTDFDGDRLLRVSREPLQVEEAVPVGDGPVGVAVGGGAVWTANATDGTVSRVDPATSEVAMIRVGHRPQGVVFANGRVWVSVRSN